MKYIAGILFLAIGLYSKAQSVSSDSFNRDSIYIKNTVFSFYPRVMMNGEKIKQNKLADIFNKVPSAMSDYEKYKRKYKIGFYFLFGIFAGATVSSISFDNSNRTLTATGLTFSFLSFVNAVIFMSSGEAKLKKAIKAYNKNVLKY
jgi:hypothetical protein